MDVHRYINLPFEIQWPSDKLFTFDTNNKAFQEVVFNENEWKPQNKQLVDFLYNNGIEIIHVESFFTHRNHYGVLHADYSWLSNHTKLNISRGGEDSGIEWYTSTDLKVFPPVPVNKTQKLKHHILTASMKTSTKIASATTHKPSLCNVGQLHRTYNHSNEDRHTLCFVLIYKNTKEVLKFDDAIKLLKEHIE